MADEVTFSELPLSQKAKWQGYSKEYSILKNYFQGFSAWQVFVILGIAVTGLMTFVNTYDAATKINQKVQTCMQSEDIKKSLNNQFIILLVISCLAIVIGIIVAWLLRGSASPRRIITWGIIFAGVFGILYAISIRVQNSTMSGVIKAGGSWALFVGFLIVGYIVGKQSDAKVVEAINALKFPKNSSGSTEVELNDFNDLK